MTVRIGISGWTYGPWRGRFYPKGLRHRDELAYVAQRMNSVEINGSFYGCSADRAIRPGPTRYRRTSSSRSRPRGSSPT